MMNLLKSIIRHLFFSHFEVEGLQRLGVRLKSSGFGLENNAIFSKYSSADKSCQGQTYGRLLDRKHYLCTGTFAWRALLKLLGNNAGGS